MVRKLSLAVILLSFITGVSFAQNSQTETRRVDKFDRIGASSGIEVCIKEGTSTEVAIEVNRDDVLSKIRTEVKNGELIIGMKDQRWKRPKNLKVKVTVSANNLRGVSASSGARIYSTHNINGGDFIASTSSGGQIDLGIKAKSISCDASSGAFVKMKGSTGNLKVESSSGANIDMKKLEAESAVASASSGANILLHVSKSLTASASSGGNVLYSGDPSVNASKSSGGNVSKR